MKRTNVARKCGGAVKALAKEADRLQSIEVRFSTCHLRYLRGQEPLSQVPPIAPPSASLQSRPDSMCPPWFAGSHLTSIDFFFPKSLGPTPILFALKNLTFCTEAYTLSPPLDNSALFLANNTHLHFLRNHYWCNDNTRKKILKLCIFI